ncbi:MAG: hypothetical protein IT361_00205 [Gemmatimonadaceae bacterium]|nr:hypothetical protein [Gemmatimonadaceae bacterium]
MFAVVLFVSTTVAAPPLRPRDCPHCGVYSGPNVTRVIDPYLRRPDIWPEFDPATCQFEVARGSFVTLTRAACSSETTWRATR